jgi:hypothetical protein
MRNRLFYSVGEVADELGVKPRVLSDLFYKRVLSSDRCPIVSGRRMIPADYLAEITAVLRSASAATVARAPSIAG